MISNKLSDEQIERSKRDGDAVFAAKAFKRFAEDILICLKVKGENPHSLIFNQIEALAGVRRGWNDDLDAAHDALERLE